MFADEANVAEAFLDGGNGKKKKKKDKGKKGAPEAKKSFKDEEGEADGSAEVVGRK